MSRKDFVAYLKRYMSEEELSVYELAVGLKTTTNTVSKWLRGVGPRANVFEEKIGRLEHLRPYFRDLKKLGDAADKRAR